MSKLFRNVPFLTSLAENSAITAFPFNNLLASPRLSRNPFIFKHSSRSMVFHFRFPFVFNNSSGSLFIFDIFLGQRPFSDPDQHIGEPPQLAQAGIFHPLHEQRIFVVGSHQRGAILG
jgi:hypothetical protein